MCAPSTRNCYSQALKALIHISVKNAWTFWIWRPSEMQRHVPLSKIVKEMKFETGKLRPLVAKHPRKPGYGAGLTEQKWAGEKSSEAQYFAHLAKLSSMVVCWRQLQWHSLSVVVEVGRQLDGPKTTLPMSLRWGWLGRDEHRQMKISMAYFQQISCSPWANLMNI